MISNKPSIKISPDSFSPASTPAPLQRGLTIGNSNDPLEYEADAVAEKIMRMPEMPFIQRCACDEEKINRKPISSTVTPFIQAKSDQASYASPNVTSGINASRGSGSSMDNSTRSFMESRFGADFSSVKIHTDSSSVQLNRELNAQAFTVGNDVYFNEGKYVPQSDRGKHLLAHELTHVLQQGSGINKSIQRTMLHGQDNFGTFSLNDRNCTFDYNQTWYFNFKVSITETEKQKLMSAAATQVHNTWSNVYPLKPTNLFGIGSCPCSKSGANVNVNIRPVEGPKTGRGIYVEVLPDIRANVHPIHKRMQLEYNSQDNDFDLETFHRPYPLLPTYQYTVAHEFGHTINLMDDYHGWTGFFLPAVQEDAAGIMNAGNTVHTRHYQPFGDMLSLLTPRCRYNPNGVREPDRENAVNRLSTLAGLTLYQDGLTFGGPNPDLSMGLNFDRRVSNERFLGLFYPTIGAIRLMDPNSGDQSDYGVTAGLRLGQIPHPLVVNLRTGIVTNPLDPNRNITIPLNVQLGLRTSKYEFGLSYTLAQDLLGERETTHLFGIGLTTP